MRFHDLLSDLRGELPLIFRNILYDPEYFLLHLCRIQSPPAGISGGSRGILSGRRFFLHLLFCSSRCLRPAQDIFPEQVPFGLADAGHGDLIDKMDAGDPPHPSCLRTCLP